MQPLFRSLYWFFGLSTRVNQYLILIDFLKGKDGVWYMHIINYHFFAVSTWFLVIKIRISLTCIVFFKIFFASFSITSFFNVLLYTCKSRNYEARNDLCFRLITHWFQNSLETKIFAANFKHSNSNPCQSEKGKRFFAIWTLPDEKLVDLGRTVEGYCPCWTNPPPLVFNDLKKFARIQVMVL